MAIFDHTHPRIIEITLAFLNLHQHLKNHFTSFQITGTSSYSAPGNFPQYIYFVLVVKNQKKIWSSCLVQEFSFTDLWRKIHDLYLYKSWWLSSYTEGKLFVAASTLLLSLHTKLPFSQKLIPYPHIFFHLKSFLWKSPLTVKVWKKFIDQILSYITFCFEIYAHLGHLFT